MGKRYEGGKQKEFWIRGKKKGKRKKKEKKALGVGSLNYSTYFIQRIIKLSTPMQTSAEHLPLSTEHS